MTTALLGYTGFVGGTLLRQHAFDDLYNSTNIEQLAGRDYDLVVCAAAPGVKWKANKEPEQDLASIRRLMAPFEALRCRKVVLISTVDVYPDPVGCDERTVIDRSAGGAYGRHRLMLEDFLAARFETLVVRLPGLFGKGLRKNALYDILTANRVDQIVPNALFQFYDMQHLWRDVQTAARSGLPLVNFAVEPTRMRDVAQHAFGLKLPAADQPAPARYDMQTMHAAAFGRSGRYLSTAQEVLDGIRDFAAGEGWVRP
jgi:nucleoside-diphosphate-sugar epimerase